MGQKYKCSKQENTKEHEAGVAECRYRCCTMQIPLYVANLGKAFPRCTALAAASAPPCNSQTRMAQLFPVLRGFLAKEKQDFLHF